MTFAEYEEAMNRTYFPNGLPCHALGLCGEAGEVADLIKKGIYHGVPYTPDQMEKELGDVLWYLTAVAHDHDLSLEQIAATNAAKLATRYPNGFVKGGGIRT